MDEFSHKKLWGLTWTEIKPMSELMTSEVQHMANRMHISGKQLYLHDPTAPLPDSKFLQFPATILAVYVVTNSRRLSAEPDPGLQNVRLEKKRDNSHKKGDNSQTKGDDSPKVEYNSHLMQDNDPKIEDNAPKMKDNLRTNNVRFNNSQKNKGNLYLKNQPIRKNTYQVETIYLACLANQDIPLPPFITPSSKSNSPQAKAFESKNSNYFSSLSLSLPNWAESYAHMSTRMPLPPSEIPPNVQKNQKEIKQKSEKIPINRPNIHTNDTPHFLSNDNRPNFPPYNSSNDTYNSLDIDLNILPKNHINIHPNKDLNNSQNIHLNNDLNNSQNIHPNNHLNNSQNIYRNNDLNNSQNIEPTNHLNNSRNDKPTNNLNTSENIEVNNISGYMNTIERIRPGGEMYRGEMGNSGDIEYAFGKSIEGNSSTHHHHHHYYYHHPYNMVYYYPPHNYPHNYPPPNYPPQNFPPQNYPPHNYAPPHALLPPDHHFPPNNHYPVNPSLSGSNNISQFDNNRNNTFSPDHNFTPPDNNLPESNLPGSNLPRSNLPVNNLPRSNLPVNNLGEEVSEKLVPHRRKLIIPRYYLPSTCYPFGCYSGGNTMGENELSGNDLGGSSSLPSFPPPPHPVYFAPPSQYGGPRISEILGDSAECADWRDVPGMCGPLALPPPTEEEGGIVKQKISKMLRFGDLAHSYVKSIPYVGPIVASISSPILLRWFYRIFSNAFPSKNDLESPPHTYLHYFLSVVLSLILGPVLLLIHFNLSRLKAFSRLWLLTPMPNWSTRRRRSFLGGGEEHIDAKIAGIIETQQEILENQKEIVESFPNETNSHLNDEKTENNEKNAKNANNAQKITQISSQQLKIQQLQEELSHTITQIDHIPKYTKNTQKPSNTQKNTPKNSAKIGRSISADLLCVSSSKDQSVTQEKLNRSFLIEQYARVFGASDVDQTQIRDIIKNNLMNTSQGPYDQSSYEAPPFLSWDRNLARARAARLHENSKNYKEIDQKINKNHDNTDQDNIENTPKNIGQNHQKEIQPTQHDLTISEPMEPITHWSGEKSRNSLEVMDEFSFRRHSHVGGGHYESLAGRFYKNYDSNLTKDEKSPKREEKNPKNDEKTLKNEEKNPKNEDSPNDEEIPKNEETNQNEMNSNESRNGLENTKKGDKKIVSRIPCDSPLGKYIENGRFVRTFKDVCLIGRGGFGAVFGVHHLLEDGEPEYAVKCVVLKLRAEETVRNRKYFREVSANRDIYSKHVVRYFTWWCEEPQFLPAFIEGGEIRKNQGGRKCAGGGRRTKSPLSFESLSSIDKALVKRDKKKKGICLSSRQNGEGCLPSFETSRSYLRIADPPNLGLRRPKNRQKKTIPSNDTNDIIFFEDDAGDAKLHPFNSKIARKKNSKKKKKETNISLQEEKKPKNTPQFPPSTLAKLLAEKSKKIEYNVVLLIQMEMCKGLTLRQWIDGRANGEIGPPRGNRFSKNPNRSPELDIFKQLIKGIKNIHEKGIVHRDLKPENVFVEPESNLLKIGDFGLARFIEAASAVSPLTMKAFSSPRGPSDGGRGPADVGRSEVWEGREELLGPNCADSQISAQGDLIGTPGYTAPEGGAFCTDKADIYAAALILLELLTPPFHTLMERYDTILQFRNDLQVPNGVREQWPALSDLMLTMGRPAPQDRPSAAQVYTMVKAMI